MVPSRKIILLLLIVCYAIAGGGLVAMKFALEAFTVTQIIFARVAFAAAFYLCLLPLWRKIPYRKGDWKYLAAMVAFEPCLFFLCETASLQFTTSSQGGVVAACFPICTAIAAWLFLSEKLSKRTVTSIILAVIGVAGVSYFGGGDERAPNPLLGNALMFLAVLAETGYAVCARRIAQRYSFLSVSAIQAIGGTLVFLPFFLTQPVPVSIPVSAAVGICYMGIGVGICVYMIFNFSLKYIEAGIVALFGNLVPVFTLLFSWILLGERFTGVQMCCFALILICVAIVARESMKKPLENNIGNGSKEMDEA